MTSNTTAAVIAFCGCAATAVITVVIVVKVPAETFDACLFALLGIGATLLAACNIAENSDTPAEEQS